MAEESEISRWQRISGRLLGLVSAHDATSATNLNLILDELNSVDYNSGIVVNSREEALAVLCKGCSLVPSDGSNSSLSSKFCQLITNICSRQKVELTQKCLDELLEFLVNSIKKCQKWAINDHLRALGAVLYETGPMCSRFGRALLSSSSEGILTKYSQDLNSDLEIQCSSIHCIGNICMKSPSGCSADDELVTIAFQVLLSLLSQAPHTSRNEFQHLRIINTNLKALLKVMDSIHCDYKALLPSLLAALKNYMFYGMPGFKPSFLESKKLIGSSELAGLKPDDISSINLQPLSVKQASYLNPQPKKKKKRTGSKKGKKEQQSVSQSQDFVCSQSNFETLAPNCVRVVKRRPNYAAREKNKVDTFTSKFTRPETLQNEQPIAVKRSEMNSLTSSFSSIHLRANAKEFYPKIALVGNNELRSNTIVNEHTVTEKMLTNGKHTLSLVENSLHVQNGTGKKDLPTDNLLDTYQGALEKDVNQITSRTTCISTKSSKTVMEHLDNSIVNCYGNRETSSDFGKPREAGSQTQGVEIGDSLNKPVRKYVQEENHKKDASHSSDSEGLSSTASSDSEFSDSDAGYALRLRSISSKVRQAALLCLQKLVKVADRKVMFGYWSSFIPDSTAGLQWSLFTTILRDSAPKARANGVGVLAELLEGSRQFLLAAEDRKQPFADNRARPFTSFSTKLAGIVQELHRCLLQALMAESFVYTKVQILKCIAVLIANAPYHRLNRGLLTKLVNHLRPLLAHKDCCVCVAVMECLAMIVSVQAPLDEVIDLMKSEASTSIACVEDGQMSDSSSFGQTPSEPASSDVSPSMFMAKPLEEIPSYTPWLILWCHQAVCRQNNTPLQPVAIRIQALQVIAAFIKHYFTLSSSSVPWLVGLSFTCSQEEDEAVALYAIKLLDELNKAMLANVVKQSQLLDELNKAMLANVVKQSQVELPSIFTKYQLQSFWIRLLEGPLTKMMQNDGSRVPKLCSAAVDCLTGIGASIFEILPHNKKILCITLLLGLCSDEDKAILASAVRALGVFVLYPCLREDVLFVADVANAVLTAMTDTSLQVRTRAAWSLANLSDSLVVNGSVVNSTFVEDFSDMLLVRVLNTSITSATDNEKVKSNAVRAIGNFLRYLTPSLLEKRDFTDCIERGVQALSRCVCVGLMKVRWNACYALGNVFRNPSLPLGTASWTVVAFNALMEVIRDCKNFKISMNLSRMLQMMAVQGGGSIVQVRYNAVLALSIPQKRNCYGEPELFLSIWETHIKALLATETITEFTEFRYRDNLREQLCGTLCHLATLVSADDVALLASLLDEEKETIKKFVTHYLEQLNSKVSADDVGGEDAVTSEKVLKVHQAQKHLSGDPFSNDPSAECLRHVFTITQR